MAHASRGRRRPAPPLYSVWGAALCLAWAGVALAEEDQGGLRMRPDASGGQTGEGATANDGADEGANDASSEGDDATLDLELEGTEVRVSAPSGDETTEGDEAEGPAEGGEGGAEAGPSGHAGRDHPAHAAAERGAATPAVVAPQVRPILSALPNDPDEGVRVEVGLVVEDLRATQRWLAARRAVQTATVLGAGFFAPGARERALGFDLLNELTWLIDLASPPVETTRLIAATDEDPPGPEPVPAAVAAFTRGEGAGLVAVMKVAPGFLARAAAAKASEQPPAWARDAAIDADAGTFELRAGEQPLFGQVDADGWLRLAPSASMLVGPVVPLAEPLFASDLVPWLERADGFVFVRGGGMAAVALSAMARHPAVTALLSDMRAVALSWELGRDETVAARLLVDSPRFALLRADLAREPPPAPLTPLWGPEVTGFLSASIPPVLLAPLGPWLEAKLLEAGHELPPELGPALAGLTGPVGLAYFGSPGDWAAGIAVTDAALARSTLSSLSPWLARLNGARVAAVGSTVVAATERQRLAALLSPERDAGRRLGDSLTPMIRAAIERPAIAHGYLVLDDTGKLRWGGLALGLWADTVGSFFEGKPGADLGRRLLAEAPAWLALEGFNWALIYDLAFTLDIRGTVLVAEVFASEI